MNSPSRFSLSQCLQPPSAASETWVPPRDRDGNLLENVVLGLFCNFAHGMLCWRLLSGCGLPTWLSILLILPFLTLVFQILTLLLSQLHRPFKKLGFFTAIGPESWGIYGYLATTTLILAVLHPGCSPTTFVWQAWLVLVAANLLCSLWRFCKSAWQAD